MKQLLLILAVVALVGCGKKELKKEDLVGAYEGKIEDDTERWIFLGNGEFEWSSSDKRYERSLEDVLGNPPHGRWTVSQNREVHLKWYGTSKTSGIEIRVFSINADGSITHVADISDGDRQDYKADLDTFKKIYKHNESSNVPARPVKELTLEQKQKALRDSVVGEYEYKREDGDISKFVFLKNGISEVYLNGREQKGYKWEIVKEEIHVKSSPWIGVYRKNKDKTITIIADIIDGKRINYSETDYETFKKIK